MTSIRERTRLSHALNEIDLSIHARLSSDEIMQAALDGYVSTLRADAGDIKVVDGTEWVVRYERGFGSQEVGLHLSADNAPVAERVAQLREPVNIVDYLEEPEDFYVGFPRLHHLRATLAVPLIVREEVVGCLFAWMKHEPRTFTPGEIDFARRMATSVALALHNARLFEAEQAERERAESAERGLATELERTRVLLRASELLTTTTDSNELLERLASALLDATGITRVFINLIDMKRGVLSPRIATGGLIAPAGRHIHFEQLSQTAQTAIANKATALLDYELPDTPAEDRAIAEANSSRLVLFVPLVSQGQLIGHISLDQPGERYTFSSEQVRVVESISAQASVALQNVQLFEREHRIAEALQHAMLAPPPDICALEVAYLYEPASAAASVGGDFYDVVDLGDSRVAFMIGDVAGKGIDAARLTSLVRDGARAYLVGNQEPASVLSQLNTLAYRFMPVDKFATAFLGVLDCSTGELCYSGAGHPAPVVMGLSTPRLLEQGPGLLGAFAEAHFPSLRTVLAPGEALVLITDGVTEARRGQRLFGESGVLEALVRLGEVPIADIPQSLLDEVVTFSDGSLRDDVVILCVALRNEARPT